MDNEIKTKERDTNEIEEQNITIELKSPKKERNPFPKPFVIFAIALVCIVICVLAFKVIPSSSKDEVPEIVTISSLERIVNVSTLSTFTAIYNGIAEVPSIDDPSVIDYYVSYEARIDAGIDFDRISFDIDNDKMLIYASIPPVYITKVNVEIASLDYIFINRDRDSSSVSKDAYLACEADAKAESETLQAIITLAKENAEKIIEALTMPFINQRDSGYRLVIEWED